MASEHELGTIVSSGENETKRPGKIFVGGLTWDTTLDDVKNYFRRFGNILDATIVKDPITGRSRGFGFVVFEDSSVLKEIFSADSHYINGKKVDTKNAFRRNVEQACRKIFVGGVDPMLPESDIRDYFASYGAIDEIDLPWDKDKNQRRAFCFVAFQSSDVVEEIIKQSKHKLGDRMVDVKKATPKQDNNSINASNNLALSILSQALNFGNGTPGGANNLLANLLGGNQNPNLNSALGGLNSSNILPSLTNLSGYSTSFQTGNPVGPSTPIGASMQNMQSQPIASASTNPYVALAAAAAAAGLIPSPSVNANVPPSMDLASWYSQLALVAAMASSQDGGHLAGPPGATIGSPVPTGMQQAYHRDNPMMHQSIPAASLHHGGTNMLPISGSHHSYGKSTRSGGPLAGGTNSGSAVGHRNNLQYHPYSR